MKLAGDNMYDLDLRKSLEYMVKIGAARVPGRYMCMQRRC